MDLHKDFADLCSLLNVNGVDFLIIGGYAVAFHGAPRFTGDLDVLIRPDIEQINRLLSTLREFGFPTHDVTASDLLEREKIGEVFHYFSKIGVAAIRLTDGDLRVGDTIQIQGPTTNLTQVVDSMQIEQNAVASATKGQSVGLKVSEKVREKDLVYRVTP